MNEFEREIQEAREHLQYVGGNADYVDPDVDRVAVNRALVQDFEAQVAHLGDLQFDQAGVARGAAQTLAELLEGVEGEGAADVAAALGRLTRALDALSSGLDAVPDELRALDVTRLAAREALLLGAYNALCDKYLDLDRQSDEAHDQVNDLKVKLDDLQTATRDLDEGVLAVLEEAWPLHERTNREWDFVRRIERALKVQVDS